MVVGRKMFRPNVVNVTDGRNSRCRFLSWSRNGSQGKSFNKCNIVHRRGCNAATHGYTINQAFLNDENYNQAISSVLESRIGGAFKTTVSVEASIMPFLIWPPPIMEPFRPVKG